MLLPPSGVACSHASFSGGRPSVHEHSCILLLRFSSVATDQAPPLWPPHGLLQPALLLQHWMRRISLAIAPGALSAALVPVQRVGVVELQASSNHIGAAGGESEAVP